MAGDDLLVLSQQQPCDFSLFLLLDSCAGASALVGQGLRGWMAERGFRLELHTQGEIRCDELVCIGCARLEPAAPALFADQALWEALRLGGMTLALVPEAKPKLSWADETDEDPDALVCALYDDEAAARLLRLARADPIAAAGALSRAPQAARRVRDEERLSELREALLAVGWLPPQAGRSRRRGRRGR